MSEEHGNDRKSRVSPMTLEWRLNKATDANGDVYYIAHDPGTDVNMNLGNWFVMVFTGKDNLPAKIVMKPRRFSE